MTYQECPSHKKSLQTSATSVSRLSFFLHCQQQTCAHTYFSYPVTTPLSRWPRQTHSQPTGHPPAHNAHKADIVNHVTPFKSLRLSPQPVAALYTYLPLLRQTLRFPHNTQAIPTNILPATHPLTLNTSEITSNTSAASSLFVSLHS